MTRKETYRAKLQVVKQNLEFVVTAKLEKAIRFQNQVCMIMKDHLVMFLETRI